MIILVISDTHGDISRATTLAKSYSYDLIFHLGDFYKDGTQLSRDCGIEVIGVAGNCDFTTKNLEKDLVLNGVKIKLIHGHKHQVKMSNALLKNIIKKDGFDIVLYGHTHVVDETYLGKSLILNPGSISQPRDGTPSYAILEIDEKGNFFARITRLSF